MSSSSLSSSTVITIVDVECQQVVDKLGRAGSYTGSLDQATQLPHGQGRMEYCGVSPLEEGDSSYEGQWCAGDWSGYGKFTCERSSYEGSFLDNHKHGLGVMIYKADGRVYNGSFRFGKITGKGKVTYPDGSTYWGHLSNEELPHGRGKLTKSDGTVYDGEFEAGIFQGHGRITHPDGRWYLGEFTDGIPNGLGLQVGSDGILCHEGTFYNGAPVQNSSFPLQRQSSDTQLIYRTKSCGSRRALVGPIPKQLSMSNIFRAKSAP